MNNTELLGRIRIIQGWMDRAAGYRRIADRFSVGSQSHEDFEQLASDIDNDVCAACEALKRDIRQC